MCLITLVWHEEGKCNTIWSGLVLWLLLMLYMSPDKHGNRSAVSEGWRRVVTPFRFTLSRLEISLSRRRLFKNSFAYLADKEGVVVVVICSISL